MIRTVGNNGGTSIDPAARHAGEGTFASKIAKAETLADLKIRAGNGEGMPIMADQTGDAFRRFSAQFRLGAEIFEGTGAHEKAETISRLRSDAKQQTKDDLGA